MIAVIEEAQAVLDPNLGDNNPFVEWTKEGRKYGLGSVLVTQQPASIPDELISQADNYFVFHLLSEGDLRTLQRANAHFSSDLLASLLNEPIPGNGVIWSSASQRAYPISMRAFDFSATYPTLLTQAVDVGGESSKGTEGGGADGDAGPESPEAKTYAAQLRERDVTSTSDLRAQALDEIKAQLQADVIPRLQSGEQIRLGQAAGRFTQLAETVPEDDKKPIFIAMDLVERAVRDLTPADKELKKGKAGADNKMHIWWE